MFKFAFELEVSFGHEQGVLDFRLVTSGDAGQTVGKANIEYSYT